ncbi:beta-N-acetylhexosaminidase [Hymenobacter sp. 15J16-1T3B]|uniref:beta-N-acetylhexosaminidase n=1 Tax=Hymenobacter sp. 15J16-1T3B TaxID=2886941 RepID=UPI001D12D9B2|nr:family 20 glycosylhydrolase [Hymenobacter sp. 15J16-1T3B]MCC3157372.1 beta-N-acetylhexosaminidase [Hymenobacter sp. 15J16-1T3B]
MLRLLLLLLALPLAALAQPAARPDTRQLLPVPAAVSWGQSRLPWQAPLRLRLDGPADPAVAPATERLLARLGRQAGRTKPTAQAPLLQIRYGKAGRMESFDEERYSLRVTPTGVTIDAPTSLGALRALATLEQLFTADRGRYYFPEVDIQDQPRFAWRGLLIDAARHFMPVSVIKRNLDGMAAVKLNVLHWHLSDDQAFRVESKVFPRLHRAGNTTPGFYTAAQIKDVLAYAAARGIRVVPEFDMPGHTTAWQVAYPRLASLDTIYPPYQSWRLSNIAFDPTKETTYTFIDSLLAELTPLFPDPYFHVGGDENDGRQWRRNPRIAQYMRANGMVKRDGTVDKHALQTQFNRRVLAMLTKYQKKMVGWDEILGPGLPPDAVIQSWQGKKSLYNAVKEGHPALLSSGYYIDLNLTAASHYAPDPLPADAPLTAEEKKRVLGGEAAMWAEYADSVVVDSRIWPRAAAVAERLWSPATVTDVPDMYRRLQVVAAELETLGLQHRRAPQQLLTMMAAGQPVAPLQTLAAVLEPVKEYKRHFQGRTYTPQTPLNRLVDAAPAESEAARVFHATLDSLLKAPRAKLTELPKTPASRRQLAYLRQQLNTWQQNDARVQPLLQLNPDLREYAPLSTQLTVVATLLLQRLEQLEKGQPASAEWLAGAQKQLETAQKPAGQAELALATKLPKELWAQP